MPERGFSFRADGPLDMRMGRDGASAADLVNGLPESALADIMYRYGEERFARRVANAIVAARREAPSTRTAELARVIRTVVPTTGGIDPATRTFQALRIEVNDELGELERGLLAAERCWRRADGWRSSPSIRSRTARSRNSCANAAPTPPWLAPPPAAAGAGAELPSASPAKPVTPSAAEIAHNPRARSARLRAAERTTAPPWEKAA